MCDVHQMNDLPSDNFVDQHDLTSMITLQPRSHWCARWILIRPYSGAEHCTSPSFPPPPLATAAASRRCALVSASCALPCKPLPLHPVSHVSQAQRAKLQRHSHDMALHPVHDRPSTWSSECNNSPERSALDECTQAVYSIDSKHTASLPPLCQKRSACTLNPTGHTLYGRQALALT